MSCGAVKAVGGRSSPLVCQLPPDHLGLHQDGIASWPDPLPSYDDRQVGAVLITCSGCGIAAYRTHKETVCAACRKKQEHEDKNDQARGDAKDNPSDSPTATTNDVPPTTVEPQWWCEACQSWRYTQPCGRDECPVPTKAIRA